MSLESDLCVSESYTCIKTRDFVPLTLLQSPLPGLHHHLLQHQGPAAVQVRNLWGVVLTWFGAMFYVLCVQFSAVIVISAGCLISLTTWMMTSTGRWRWRQTILLRGIALWTSRPPSPSRRILGMSSRKIPLYLTHPAILLPGMKSHPLVLVEGTRPVRFCRPVRIPLPVLAVRTCFCRYGHTRWSAHHPGGGSNACSAVLCPPHILAAGMRGV